MDDERKSTREEVSDASTALGVEMMGAMDDVVRSVVTCTGTHTAESIKYVGPLEVYICADARCAHVRAHCTHQLEIPEAEDSNPRKYTKSICTWNKDGTVLTCTFCGKDGT